MSTYIDPNLPKLDRRLIASTDPSELPPRPKRCDHVAPVGAPPCRVDPPRAPRVLIPSTTPYEPGHRPLRIMTTLHYCDRHIGDLDVQAILDDRMKARVEEAAKRLRPADFKPDFDHAVIEAVLVTTPEYRAFEASIEVRRV